MSNICGQCAYYKQMPFNEDICTKTGKVVPFLSMRDCWAERIVEEPIEETLTQIQEEMETKVCKECGRELPIDAFQTQYRSADGHCGVCRECMNKKKSDAMKAKTDKPAVKPTEVSTTVEEAFTRAENNISSATDQELVDELRARGWEVKCSRTIEL